MIPGLAPGVPLAAVRTTEEDKPKFFVGSCTLEAGIHAELHEFLRAGLSANGSVINGSIETLKAAEKAAWRKRIRCTNSRARGMGGGAAGVRG